MLLLLSLLAGVPPLPPPSAAKVDFARDVKPILARACLSCHDATKARGGLRLDDGPAALFGGNSGKVILPGKSAESRLVKLVAGHEEDLPMPPAKDKRLSSAEVSLLRAWIDQGATFPKGDAVVTRPASSHWAFKSIASMTPPDVKDPSWSRNGIDRFVLSRLEREGVTPSPEADRVTLLRRLYLDLLGLPPTPEEAAAFLNDTRPDAYERVVDRVLASPHFGERFGRHWLDLARYADSDGYEKDTTRPHAWRYRHWVISALNADLGYDDFTRQQLAGDLLPGATTETKIATGFHRNTLTNKEGGADREQFRVEAVVDRVNTTAKIWLGLTLGCAQCHDHKYDPLSQREYYRMFAFFDSDVEADIPAPVTGRPVFVPVRGGTIAPMAQTLALGKPRTTRVMIKGDFLRPGVEVTPGVPAVMHAMPEAKKPTRADLAAWVTAKENPLTPRVAVNWVWHKLFGRGLVATLDDFGTQGEKPSHPELLDYLADGFRRDPSMKRLLRDVVRSATYRQSSTYRDDLAAKDPYNVLLARQSRRRLEAEIVRDTSLAASGLLTTTVGGPSVRPPQPAGISELSYAGSVKWAESKGPDRTRRGLYTHFQRTSPYPMLMTFDAPDGVLCAVARDRSNTPLQALTLLNDAVFVECAKALAARVQSEAKGDGGRLSRAFSLVTSRTPTAEEASRLAALLAKMRALTAADPAAAKKFAGTPELAAWAAVARVILNLDEAVTRE